MKQFSVQQLVIFILMAASVDARRGRYRSQRNTGGGDSVSTAGNRVQASYRLSNINANGANINLGVHAAQQGGQAMTPVSKRDIELAIDLFQRDFGHYLDPETASLVTREAFMDGGHARGGKSRSSAGNRASNVQNFENLEIEAGATLNLASLTKQRGGNSKSGRGGHNFGSGGKGGSLSFGFGRRDLVDYEAEELDLMHRRGYLDAQADMELLIPRFMDGGDASGGDSQSSAGQRASKVQNFNGLKIKKGAKVDLRTFVSQAGGNSVSGDGGNNGGNAGSGGSMSFDFKMPGMPKIPGMRRRELGEEVDARELSDEDIFWSLQVRDEDSDALDP